MTSTIQPMKSNSDLKFHSSGLGYMTLMQLIQLQLDRLSDDTYYQLREVFDDYCVYSVTGKFYKRSFTVKVDTQQVTLADDAQEVVERVKYEPTDVVQSASKSYSKVMPMRAHGYPGEPKAKQVPITVQTGVKPTDSASQLVTQHLKTKDIPDVTSEVKPMRALGIDYSGGK